MVVKQEVRIGWQVGVMHLGVVVEVEDTVETLVAKLAGAMYVVVGLRLVH